MKTVTKVVLSLLASAALLAASQEPARAYVMDCACCAMTCIGQLFGIS